MPADGSSDPRSGAELEHGSAKCGIVLIGHGNTASALLEAARAIVPGRGLDDVIAIDAGLGQTEELRARVCAAVEQVDEGRGIVLIADLLGSSPCMCGVNQSAGHGFALVTGLNLAMLTKLAIADRRGTPREIAKACADSAQRSVCVKVNDDQGQITSCTGS
jgi:PTS system mannose-specific IIA component